jgi:hypothetical protein
MEVFGWSFPHFYGSFNALKYVLFGYHMGECTLSSPNSWVVDRCMYPLYSKYICTTLLLLPCLYFSFPVCQVKFH